MAGTVRLGGIKLSGELVQLDFLESKIPGPRLAAMLQSIVSAKANIPHLHQGNTSAGMQTTLCLTAEEYKIVQTEMERHCSTKWHRVLPSVGTISLFPHGFSLSLVSRILHALAARMIPIHGISTSVSALVIHTDYGLLDEAVEQILTVCHLPENHTPLRPVIVLGDEEIETVAVYWEPKIRIYGMDMLEGLVELRLAAPTGVCTSDSWCEHGLLDSKFRMFTQQVGEKNTVFLSVLAECGKEKGLEEVMSRITSTEKEAAVHRMEGVELVSFHGPHFQDRYGIAEMAFSRLSECGIKLLSCGCTGTTVHLAVEKGISKLVSECLSDTFVVP